MWIIVPFDYLTNNSAVACSAVLVATGTEVAILVNTATNRLACVYLGKLTFGVTPPTRSIGFGYFIVISVWIFMMLNLP